MPLARFYALLFLLVAGLQPLRAQGDQMAPVRSTNIDLDVQVSGGGEMPELPASAFTVLDNGAPQALTSFHALHAGQQPVHVTLLIDAVNTRYINIAYERNQIESFLKSGTGPLPEPTELAVLTDKGLQTMQPYTTDREALLNAARTSQIGLRDIGRSAGFWGADERLQYSLNGMGNLIAAKGPMPGRKLVIWISPGWPLLSGARIYLDAAQQDGLFRDVVLYSTQLRMAQITLYNINPLGVGEPLLRANYYQDFVKGVRKPGDVQIGNLGLQVLAVQSGGLVFESNSDIASMIKQSLRDADGWYELSFLGARSERPNEYHHIEVRVNGATGPVRTRDGYYAQP